MVQKYRIFTDKDYPYFITCTIVDWLPLFTQASYQKIVLDALAYLRSNKHTQLNAFVLMPSHLHVILWPESGIRLSDVIRDFKRFTFWKISAAAERLGNQNSLRVFTEARRHLRSQVSNYMVWQAGYHPEAIFSQDFARQKMDYIHSNPVRAGLAATAEDWQFSSARAYYLEDETYPITDRIVF